MTAVYVLLWLISSSVFADAVSKIKMYTNPEEYFNSDYICECVKDVPKCTPADNCAVKYSGNFGAMNASIVSVVYFSKVLRLVVL